VADPDTDAAALLRRHQAALRHINDALRLYAGGQRPQPTDVLLDLRNLLRPPTGGTRV